MNAGTQSRSIVAVLLALAGTALLTVVRVPVPADARQAAAVCTFPFYAQVYQGPDTGLVLRGNVTLSIESSGNAFGILSEDDGTQVGVVAQATGRMLSMLLQAGGGDLSVVGTAESEVRACGFTTIFGPLVGPAIDDSGSWGQAPPCLPYPACRSETQ